MELKPNALACPHCGSDESTGWKEACLNEHPDVAPFDADDYEDTLRKEFGKPRRQSKPLHWKAILVGVVIIILILLRVFRVSGQ